LILSCKPTEILEQKKGHAATQLLRKTLSPIEGIVAVLVKIMSEIMLDRAVTEPIAALSCE
jgi:hypothetical protein